MTPDQTRASARLIEAIEAAIEAFDPQSGDLLGDFVVLAAVTRIDADGDVELAEIRLERDGWIPQHRVVSLLENARDGVRNQRLLEALQSE